MTSPTLTGDISPPADEPPATLSPTPAELAPALVDRELSWLEFNRRVLNEALDERTPLLERVKFLGIFSSNLDEFFMKRIALIRPMPGETGVAAEESREQLEQVRATVIAMLAEQAECFRDVHPAEPRGARRASRRLGRPLARAARRGVARLRHADLAGADAAEPRRGAPVPRTSRTSRRRGPSGSPTR